MNKIIMTYGTLRKGGIYHKRFLESKNAKFLGQEKIKGFEMYNLVSYPAIIKGEGEVVVEIYQVTEKVFERIDRMEKLARYNSEEIIINKIKATLWFFDKKTLKEYSKAIKIEHGDYIKFKHEVRLSWLKKSLKDIEEEIIKEEKLIKQIQENNLK